MRRAAAVFALAAAAAACGDERDDNLDPEGAAVVTAELETGAWRTWTPAPGYEAGPRPSSTHRSDNRVYHNAVLVAAAGSGAATWPDGSATVKEIFRNGAPLALAYMVKRNGVWLYYDFGWNGTASTGKLIASGRAPSCVACHRGGGDELFTVRAGR